MRQTLSILHVKKYKLIRKPSDINDFMRGKGLTTCREYPGSNVLSAQPSVLSAFSAMDTIATMAQDNDSEVTEIQVLANSSCILEG